MTTSTTLAAIVDDNPAAARVLERHELDYCCGGQDSFDEACARQGLDPDQVRAEIDAVATSDEAPWTTMGPAELVDHLEATHHRYLHDELPRLAALAEKVRDVHAERHPELHEVATNFRALHADLDPHLRKEEQVLFPMIRELDGATTAPSFHCGTLNNPIRTMLMEHDQAGELLATLRRVTDGYRTPSDGCASYEALYRGLEELEADTHLHVHKENNVLFPAVLARENELATDAR